MTVTLTGFMASGKTTAGRHLAESAGYHFIDLDEYIEARAGRSIPEIFASDGEHAFRTLESQFLREILNQGKHSTDGLVLALGGGTILDPRNAALVKEHSICVWLDTPLSTIKERLASDPSERPLLKIHDIDALFTLRRPIYSAAADIVVR